MTESSRCAVYARLALKSKTLFPSINKSGSVANTPTGITCRSWTSTFMLTRQSPATRTTAQHFSNSSLRQS